jgi:Sec-independent protein secretion pathway component TatC
MIFRDLHEFGRPGFLEEIMTGIVNGVQITEGLMLIGGIMAEIPISMVLLSRVLKYRINRWANIMAGAITIAFVINNGVKDLDDIFFATIEIVALTLIVWCAWKWRRQKA